MGRVFSLGEDDLWHAAADVPPEIDAGKIADMVKAQPLDCFRGSIERDPAVPVLFEKILYHRVCRHDCNNTDMERRIIS